MANKFQIKRTSTPGRTPNTTNSGNSRYIDTGELALNLADGKMFSSDGTIYFEVGANLQNLSVTGNATINAIIANGSIGSVGQVLASNGSALYWSTSSGTGTVTQVNTGIGLAGGPVTSSGTISVNANNGITANTTGLFVNPGTGTVVNATGVHVNSSYIGTLAANSATYLGGNTASDLNTYADTKAGTAYSNAIAYSSNATNISSGTLDAARLPLSAVQNTDSRTLSGNLQISGTYFNPSSNNVLLGNSAQRWVVSANTLNASGLITGLAGANIQGTANLVDVNVSGNLTVSGTTTYINTTNLNIGDNIITLNADLPGATAPTENAGLEINRGSLANVSFLWNETSDSWTSGNTDITGYANASVSVNSALLTVGTAFIANTLGVYHTGTVNAASYTTTGFVANTTAIAPTSNTILLGNSIGRFVVSANTADFSGAVTGTVANMSTSVNSALLTVGTSFIANTTGAYHTGLINAASINIGGSGFIANSTAIVLGDPVTANATTGTAGQALFSNGTIGSPYWGAVLTSIGPTYVQNTDSRTLSGNLVISGTYFNPSANTILLGNTLQRWVLSANTIDSSGLITGGAGATITGQVNATTGFGSGTINATSNGLFASATTISLGNSSVNVAITPSTIELGTQFDANSTGLYHTGTVNAASVTVGTNFIANSTAIVGTGYANVTTSVNSALLTVGTSFIANTTGAYHTGTVNAASVTIGSTFIANTTGAYHTGTVNAASFTTTNFTANTSGAYPLSNTAGTALGAATQRWIVNANTINASGLITGSSGANITGTANLVDVNITGNLTVSGTTTYVNTTNLNVGDNIITLNADVTNLTAPTENAGVEVNRGSAANVSFLWNETSDSWTAGNTDITGYANATVSVNSALLTVGTSFIANTTGAYHTGTVNAASHTVGSSFIANSTAIVGTGYANVTTSVNSALLTVGTAFIANTTGTYHTGVVNAATLSVGSFFVANSTTINFSTINATSNGITANTTAIAFGNSSVNVSVNTSSVNVATYLSGSINATSNGFLANSSNITVGNSSVNVTITTAGITSAGGTGVNPFSNTVGTALGTSTQRWVLNANTGSFAGAVSGITTLAAGNTTVTGFVNATSTIQGGSSLTIAGAASGITTLAAGNTTVTGFVNATSTIQGGSSLTIAGAASGITTLAAGNTTITGFANASVSVNSALLTVGTSFIANTTGAYHTGTVNAASHTVGTSFIANSSVLVVPSTVAVAGGGATAEGGQIVLGYGNNLAASIVGQANNTFNLDIVGGNTASTPLFRTFFQNADATTTAAFNVANTGRMHVGSLSEQTDSTFKVTGTANVTSTIQGGSSLTIAGALSGVTTAAMGNTTVTGFVNATSTIQGGSSLTIAGAASGITTLAAGNTTITGFANASVSVNSALLTVGTSFIANTLGVYHTGLVNAASHTVGSSFIANTTQVTLSGIPLSANGSTGTAAQVLTSNGTVGSPYWSTVSSGSTVTATDDTTTAASRYLLFANQTSGTVTAAYVSSTKLTYNPSTGTLSSTVVTGSSDERLKTNIITIANPLTTIEKLRGVSFDRIDTGLKDYGVIAQEIEQVIPDVVHETVDGYKSVSYSSVIGFLIEGMKHQQERIVQLENKLEELVKK